MFFNRRFFFFDRQLPWKFDRKSNLENFKGMKKYKTEFRKHFFKNRVVFQDSTNHLMYIIYIILLVDRITGDFDYFAPSLWNQYNISQNTIFGMNIFLFQTQLILKRNWFCGPANNKTHKISTLVDFPDTRTTDDTDSKKSVDHAEKTQTPPQNTKQLLCLKNIFKE